MWNANVYYPVQTRLTDLDPSQFQMSPKQVMEDRFCQLQNKIENDLNEFSNQDCKEVYDELGRLIQDIGKMLMTNNGHNKKKQPVENFKREYLKLVETNG